MRINSTMKLKKDEDKQQNKSYRNLRKINKQYRISVHGDTLSNCMGKLKGTNKK